MQVVAKMCFIENLRIGCVVTSVAEYVLHAGYDSICHILPYKSDGPMDIWIFVQIDTYYSIINLFLSVST